VAPLVGAFVAAGVYRFQSSAAEASA
jgi:hypothetical protein